MRESVPPFPKSHHNHNETSINYTLRNGCGLFL
jgi:hypothetical protein